MTKTRNTSLDVLKGVAALFVIWIHEQFPGVFGSLVNHIGAFAVPVFFMVSGYFSHGAIRTKLQKSIRHIISLIAIAYGLNLLRVCIFQGAGAMLGALADAFSPRTLALWIVLNITPISGVAWFLFALLYCYILHWVFHARMKDRRVFLLIPACIAAGLAVRLFLPSIGTNNAWFCGIPCYLLGRWCRENQGRLVEQPVSRFVLVSAAGLALLIAGTFVESPLGYLGAFLLAGGLFALCVKQPALHHPLLGRLGSTYAFFLYIGHALMIHVFNALLPVGDSAVLAWTRPILLAAATVGCAAVWYDVIRRKR